LHGTFAPYAPSFAHVRIASPSHFFAPAVQAAQPGSPPPDPHASTPPSIGATSDDASDGASRAPSSGAPQEVARTAIVLRRAAASDEPADLGA
jgi:hypothetical protein